MGCDNKLKVGLKTYLDDDVPNGFYDSISSLKTRNQEDLNNCDVYAAFNSDYLNILKICKSGNKIPTISEQDAFDLLQGMKPDVNDFFGVTPQHYNYAGPAGWRHFYLLLSVLIDNVNDLDITEVNATYACILFKGHKKDKNSDRSYRTISTCPVIAKGMDTYVRKLNVATWNKNQSECQFQGEGSSHELAALLVTECIQHSLHHLKQPLYVLYLDARSAFDVVLKELLIKNLYFTGTTGETLLYLNTRLENRQTFLDWNGQLMGPIQDEQGLEQGGINSSDFYKIFGQEQLKTAQASELGVSLGPLTVSGIGLADDTALLANSLLKLYYLLHLTNIFCSKYKVQLCAEKTKLQVYSKKETNLKVDYEKNSNPININGEGIKFTDSAEHVGLVRSASGNLPSILARISAHKAALGAVLHTGMARSHRGNPSASLHIHQMYANSVLFSGLGSLVLNDQEVSIVNQHHKETLSNLQRLIPFTPRPVIHFLGGVLPGTAFLHLRQLSLFGMITRSPNSIHHKHALNIFDFVTVSPKSWMHQIRDLCLQYALPHPATLLSSPPSKESFRNLVKKKVTSYWEVKLRAEAAPMTSLEFFNPMFMSLSSPHPLWTSAGSSPSKVVMATVQAKLLSGRFRTQALCSHWQNNDKKCKLSLECNSDEDIPHILKFCISLNQTREKLLNFTRSYCNDHKSIANIALKLCNIDNPDFCQFLLDCSTIPEVIQLFQQHGPIIHTHLFNITRIWCYSLHRDRLKILGRWTNFEKA